VSSSPDADGETLLELEGVDSGYGEVQVLDDLSMHLESDDVV
jgi:branched-chain amino acid transport system ATP-binding protein